jgi:hypothetical protein
MTIERVSAMISAAALLTVFAIGCAREVSGIAAMDKDVTTGVPGACTEVSAPMTPIPAEEDDEPRLSIPQPSGWHETPESELVRFGMANASLTAGRLALAAVDLKSKPGSHDPETVFDELRSDAEKDPTTTDLTITDTTVCGYPAKAVNYTRLATGDLPTRTETMLAVVAQTAGKTHAVIVNMSTNDATDPAYQRDHDTILTGFQLLASTE